MSTPVQRAAVQVAAAQVADAAVKTAGAAVARAVRAHDPEALTVARRNLTAAGVEKAIRRALASAPPLTDDQRARLAALLRPQGGERS